MYRGKKILAIIPARSGSKGLENKNIRKLEGKPLIAHTIESAKKSGVFEDVVVSTDSPQYADIALSYGAEIPFLRSAELATDTANTRDVVCDLIKKMENMQKKYDCVMILQPTSPLRQTEDIIGSVDIMIEKKANAIVSMCECDHPIEWSVHLEEELRLDGLSSQFTGLRQNLRRSYRLNGAIYLANTEYYLEYSDLYRKNCYAYIMKKERSIDIDDLFDFKIAEMILQNNMY